jgi:Protein of unknown function (DUF3223)
MGRAQPVDLGLKTFRSESAARGFFKKMLNRYSPGDTVSVEDDLLLRELIKRHPEAEAKIGEGIDHFEVMSHSFNSQCFAVHRTDGSFEDFSYTWCVSAG